ncbi:CAZyme family GH114 [Penicillium samsonianum]|uniref:CAZyme family GH114 n=1 Tax=Penicillium samsonianum TaxID=1882272 RepID=UPI002546DEE0|nr:CAZyme family GH114 [Penicillium samsonianum]KAJ6128663.1 CAZyme family GH114 [Penicillium samsonianum]
MMKSSQPSRWQVLAAKRKLIVSCILGLFFLAIGMDIRAELGSGHSQKKMVKRDTTSTSDTSIWQPTAGVKWQIQLIDAVEDTTIDADIWDIDLFDNTAETITTLHGKGHKVICYFSAGTYEDWRPDVSKFDTADLGSNLDDWPGERWLNIKSSKARAVMSSRLDMAKQKGCDGVDPDNIDAYNNENGLGLTEADSVDFLTFLAAESHSRGMSIGLKNGGDIIGSVIDKMQWSVNEQCAQYNECEVYAAFTEVNKPVFHIEYAGETIESGGSTDTSDSAAETTTKSKATATATLAATTAATTAVTSTATSTAAAISTADATKTGSTTSTTDASADTDADDEEDEDQEDEDEEDEDDEDNEKKEASADSTKEKSHRYGHGHHKLRARAALSSTLKTSACNAANAGKFSTVIKNMNLDAWVEYC